MRCQGSVFKKRVGLLFHVLPFTAEWSAVTVARAQTVILTIWWKQYAEDDEKIRDFNRFLEDKNHMILR